MLQVGPLDPSGCSLVSLRLQIDKLGHIRGYDRKIAPGLGEIVLPMYELICQLVHYIGAVSASPS